MSQQDISWIRGVMSEYAVEAVVMEEDVPRIVVAFQEEPDGWAIYRRARPGASTLTEAEMLTDYGLFHDANQALLNAQELALEEHLQKERDALADEHPDDELVRQAAAEQYEEEGTLEIDAGAVVSRGDDPGAYVQAWVWVDFSSVPGLSMQDDEDAA